MSVGAAFLNPQSALLARRFGVAGSTQTSKLHLRSQIRIPARSPHFVTRCMADEVAPQGGRASAAVLQQQEGSKSGRTPRREKLDLQVCSMLRPNVKCKYV